MPFFAIIFVQEQFRAEMKFTTQFISSKSVEKWWRTYQEECGSGFVMHLVVTCDTALPQL